MRMNIKAMLIAGFIASSMYAANEQGEPTKVELLQNAAAQLLQEQVKAQPQVEQVIPPIRKISDEKIILFKGSVESFERKRFMIRTVVVGAAYFGAAYALKKIFSSDPMPGPGQMEINRTFVAEQANLRRDFQIQRAAQDDQANQNLPFLRRVWNGATRFGSKVLDWTPWFIQELVRGQFYGQMGRILFGSLPFSINASGYLMDTNSLERCMKKMTHFWDATAALMNWTYSVAAAPQDTANVLEDLSTSGAMFLTEMEKILGYMMFVTSKLKADQADKLHFANNCMKSICDETNLFADKINRAVLNKDNKQETKILMVIAIKQSLFKIICKMENFAAVQNAVGYANEYDPFPALKGLVLPELKEAMIEKPSQEMDPFQQMLGNMAVRGIMS